MKTYSEVEGKKPFDWNKALNSKINTQIYWGKLFKKANRWVTCACGNQCHIIPRSIGIPVDTKLRTLGNIFTHHINNNYKIGAKITLEQIEKRSAILIKRIKVKKAKSKLK